MKAITLYRLLVCRFSLITDTIKRVKMKCIRMFFKPPTNEQNVLHSYIPGQNALFNKNKRFICVKLSPRKHDRERAHTQAAHSLWQEASFARNYAEEVKKLLELKRLLENQTIQQQFENN